MGRTSRPTTTPRDRTTAPTLLPFSHNTATMASVQSVQCFGKKKTATAVAHCKAGKGLIKVNGQPLSLVKPQVLRFKVYEPVLLRGGGHTSQVYAIRQAIAKGIIAYYQKYVD